MTPIDDGARHLVWIMRFQALLLVVGTPLWAWRSGRDALAFAAGGLLSLAFWQLHILLVSRMLNPKAPRRWLYGALSLGKLALIALGVRAIMACLPGSSIPLVVGILLFIGGILLEAGRLILRPDPPADDPEQGT